MAAIWIIKKHKTKLRVCSNIRHNNQAFTESEIRDEFKVNIPICGFLQGMDPKLPRSIEQISPTLEKTIKELSDKALCDFTKDLELLSKKSERKKIYITLHECYCELSKRNIPFSKCLPKTLIATQTSLKKVFRILDKAVRGEGKGNPLPRHAML